MNKATRELLKKNNEREKLISKENDNIYTDMVVYMRGADITEYNQELVREDIIELILEGQERGDDINQVMGGNYKQVCDDILEVMPKKTIKEKVIGIIETTLSVIWILGVIYVTKTLLAIVLSKAAEYQYTLTLGNIISGLIIAFVSNYIVEYVCKNAFKEQKKRTAKRFARDWLIVTVVILAISFSNIYITIPVVTVHIAVAYAVVAGIFTLEKAISMF